jgi:hypothetical protein
MLYNGTVFDGNVLLKPWVTANNSNGFVIPTGSTIAAGTNIIGSNSAPILLGQGFSIPSDSSVLMGNVEVDTLTVSTSLKTTDYYLTATDQDYALLDVSGGTTGQQNGNNGILTYSPQTGYQINLANPSTTLSRAIYLIGSAPSGLNYGGLTSTDPNSPYETNNMGGGIANGLSGDPGSDDSATSFGIYSYVQGISNVPNLIAVLNGTNLGSFLDSINGLLIYEISNVGTAGVTGVVDPRTGTAANLIVNGQSGVNNLGGLSQTIAHTNNSVYEPFTDSNNISNWYRYSGFIDLSNNYIYGGDIASYAKSNTPANADVHNFLGMGAFYELYNPTNGHGYDATTGVTDLSSKVKLV